MLVPLLVNASFGFVRRVASRKVFRGTPLLGMVFQHNPKSTSASVVVSSFALRIECLFPVSTLKPGQR